MRPLRLLALYTRRKLLAWMGMRAFLITLTINQAVTPLLGLAVWSVALPGQRGITNYYVALLVVQLLTVSYEHHTFSNGIYSGELSHDLLRPHPVILPIIGENVAMRCWHLLAGFPLIAVAALGTGVAFDPRDLLLALPALALAATLRFLFIYLLALSALWTQRAHGVVGLGETLLFLLGGTAAPVALFPHNLRPLGEALPFRAMLGFPAEVVAGGLGGVELLTGYIWQGIWLLVLAPVAVLVWGAGVRRYVAMGG